MTASKILDALSSQYEVLSQIGSGGWSTVYKARHTSLDQLVAIKILHQHLASDSRMVKRFQQEAKTAAGLSHPNIVQILDFGTDPEPFIVMEYLDGTDLAGVLASKKSFSASETIGIGIAICRAVDAAHQKGIIHRDLKPSNIIVPANSADYSDLKVVDFGLSKLLEPDPNLEGRLSRSGETFGSPPYMSPEQWTAKDVDTRSDIYSLGCLLYELVTGTQAFPGNTIAECMHAHLTDMPDSIASLRPELPEIDLIDRIVFATISKEQTKRYQSIPDLIEDLQRAKSAKAPLHAGRRRRSLAEWFKYRRPVMQRLLVATALLVLLAGTVAYINRTQIIDSIWRFNYTAGEKALASKDFTTAAGRFDTALKALDQGGQKDVRLYRTLHKFSIAQKENHNWSDVYNTNQRMEAMTKGSRRYQDCMATSWNAWLGGRYGAAEQSCRDAIADARKESDSNLALSEALNHLGMVLEQTRNYKEAENALRESLKIRTAWIDEEDAKAAACRNKIRALEDAQQKQDAQKQLNTQGKGI